MRILLLGAALVLSACVETGKPPEKTTGAADYNDYCAACHGPAGKGDGAAAAGLAKKPADLSHLAARNKGVFPTTR